MTKAQRDRCTRGAGIWVMSLILLLPLAACDSDPAGTEEGSAVVVGTVESTQGAAAPAAAPGPSASFGEAHTVAIGRFNSSGAFQSMAEGAVDAAGDFRIEGVPAGHANLVIVAQGEAGAEVGRAVLHEETRAGVEHPSHPVNATSTLHARVWGSTPAAGSQGMSSAELALFIHADASRAEQTAESETQVQAIASGAVTAQSAITTILDAEGPVELDREARAELLIGLVVERDRSRANGVGAESSQRAFTSSALDLFTEQGLSAEALAIAYAAATTGLDRAMAQANAHARLDIAREAILLNLESRQRAAAAVEADGLGIRTAILAALSETESEVAAASSLIQLHAALESSRVNVESRVLGQVESQLSGLPVELLAEIRGDVQVALAQARLWVGLESATSAEAMGQAAASFRSGVEAAVGAFVADLPSEVQSQVSVDVLTTLFIALGAGPHTS